MHKIIQLNLDISFLEEFLTDLTDLFLANVEGLGKAGKKTKKAAVQNELVQIFGAPCWGGGVTP